MKDKKMWVTEIFESIEGEGKRAGQPSVFVRLAGCNLRCRYCDTKFSLPDNVGQEMTVPEILEEVKKFGVKNITLTGGEPLKTFSGYQLAEKLADTGLSVNIETNGSKDLEPLLGVENIFFTMDYKSPFSEQTEKMLDVNLSRLRKKDVLKIVVCEKDLAWLEVFIKKLDVKCPVYLSPVFGLIDLKVLAETVKKLQKLREDLTVVLQLQLHKIIWEPDQRGV